MEFQIGDQVVHPIHGVGTVKTVSTQSFTVGQLRQYYEVVAGGLTVWVPVDDQGTTVLRGITPKGSLHECRRLLSSRPVPFDASPKIRQLELAERLKGGLLPALCQTVRDLSASGTHRTLPATEGRLLKRISKALCDEWAASAGVRAQDALSEIEGLLQAGRAPQAGAEATPPRSGPHKKARQSQY